MKTKNIFKTLAFAMMMPAMLLTTACSSEDELANNKNIDNTETAINKGYELPVTVNVTRQGDSDMRATYNESTRKLEFSAGDKLFVEGSHEKADRFAGTLTWQSGGTFSGTIYTESPYEGTIDDLLNGNYATLLPAGYESYDYLEIMYEGYEARLGENAYNSFATSKKLGVEQLSFEHGEYTSGTGFELEPQKAILNFTITGLTSNTKVTATLSDDEVWTPDIEGEVTTDGSGNATFAIGLDDSSDLNEYSLSVAGNAITLVSSSKVLAAGKIYNITRNAIPGALVGKFSVSDTKKVYFSKGNLQYTKSTGIWSFMDHQYSTVETTSQAIGTDYASQDVVSLFGWGTSGWNNGNTYYQPYNTSKISSSYGYGYGPKNETTYTYDLTGTYANADWGLYNAISNGGNTAGTWRTLTKDEWTYLLTTRTASTVNGTADARYAKAYLFGTTHGVIIFPDIYTHPAGVTAPTGINATNSTSWNGNQYNATDWAKMEAAGCVFLPAAGRRDGTNIFNVNAYVRYWTSTYNSKSLAHNVGIADNSMNPADYNQKDFGFSVRLVRDAN
jgi:hypothetical protein